MSETATLEAPPFVSAYAELDAMTNEFVEEHRELINKIATGAHKGATMFDIEDIEQAIWVRLIQGWSYIRDCSAYQIRGYANRAASLWCQEQRLDYMEFIGSYTYTPKDVMHILETSIWTELGEAKDVNGRIDIERALGKLTDKQHAAVVRRYKDGEKLSTSTDKATLSRAVDALTKELNGKVTTKREPLDSLEVPIKQ